MQHDDQSDHAASASRPKENQARLYNCVLEHARILKEHRQSADHEQGQYAQNSVEQDGRRGDTLSARVARRQSWPL